MRPALAPGDDAAEDGDEDAADRADATEAAESEAVAASESLDAVALVAAVDGGENQPIIEEDTG